MEEILAGWTIYICEENEENPTDRTITYEETLNHTKLKGKNTGQTDKLDFNL